MTARAGALALLVMLKSAARLGRVPKLGEILQVVVDHVRDQAGLAAGTVPEADSERSEVRYRSAVHERLELKHKPGGARAVAEAAMRAPVKGAYRGPGGGSAEIRPKGIAARSLSR